MDSLSVDEAHSEKEVPLPIVELDRLLTPVRRTLGWAVAHPEQDPRVLYLESNVSRWLLLALELDLPEALRDPLVEMAGLLGGIGSLNEGAAQDRVIALGVVLARVDAIVGLPLAGGPKLNRLRKPRVKKGGGKPKGEAVSAATSTQEEPAPRERKSRRRRGGRSKRSEAPDPKRGAAPAAPAGPPPWSLSGKARSLAGILDADLAGPLADAGLTELHQLVLKQPVDVEVVRPIHGAGRPVESGRRALGGRVRSRCTRISASGETQTEVVLHGAGPVVAVWTGVPRRAIERLAPNARGVLVGRYEPGDTPKLLEPELAVDDGKKAARLSRYGIVGLPDQVVREAISQVAPLLDVLRDPLPARILKRGRLPALGEAVADLHFRAHARSDARRRLAFNEALALWVARSRDRFEGSRRRGIPHSLAHGMVARLGQVLDLETTDDQQLVLEEIKRDLTRQHPMLRLLTGDTGSGKGLVALLAAVHVAEGKGQIIFELPDAVSAEYRFLFAEPLFRELGLVARLVQGEPTRGQRDALRRGEVHVLFGHGLLEAGLEFRRLGMVVALEHDSPGSTSERVLQLPAPRPDTLVMTTSQVPAETLLAHYGEHDVSLLTPAHRADMAVQVLPASQRAVAYASAAAALELGQQVTVIFPLVAGKDALDRRELGRVKSALEADAFPGSRVAVFHGDMARDERYAIYEDFRRHRFDVLVATGPFEMGPPIPRASVTVVEQADRMDPIRLHRACRHLSKSQVPSVRAFFVTGDVPDPVGALHAERVATRGDELQLVREIREGVLPEPPRTGFLDIRRDRELLLAAHQLVHASAATDTTFRRSPLGDAMGDVELVWRMLHPGEDLELPERPSGGRRRRRRRKRKD